MPLADIIDKEPTIATPSAKDVASAPEEWERKFQYHVATYVAIADMESRWDAILNNLLKGQSATGLIYADTGYGKTSTGASLWKYAEAQDIVTVPPFIWNSLADMLTATHGWVYYRLKVTRPELIPNLEQKHQAVVKVDEEVLAQRIAREDGLTSEQARRAIERLKAEGRLLDALSPLQLLDYLRFATETLLKAGYKGLLILPDEFELFKDNLNTAQNYNYLKDFIFGIHGEEGLPIGCVAFTYRQTQADIDRRAKHILARFNKPEGSLIDLEQSYGQTEFARHLWDKLAVSRRLSPTEESAIDGDVLDALGQFLRHSRARDLMSGPRSVVKTFNRASLHYTEKNRSYSLYDFCEDYLSGHITYGSQETETVQAHTQIMESGIINNDKRRKLVKLLCVHPAEGVPPEVLQRHGIPDSERGTVVESLLGQHVITKVTGRPTLACYRDDLLGVDKLNEILKLLKDSFNPTNPEVHRGAVRAFRKHVFPEIITPKGQGALVGWTGTQDPQENSDGNCIMNLSGTPPNLREYPNRKLIVGIGTEEFVSSPSTSATQLQSRFILDTTGSANNTCHITPNGIEFRFDIQKSINPQKIPEDIGKLGELFLPESITPLLLLSMLDFFDDESTGTIVQRENQETEVNFLKERILNELVGCFFSPEIKTAAVFAPSELATYFASVPAGKDFVEGALRGLIPKQFPEYSAVAVSNSWQRYLRAYQDTLRRQTTLGTRRGIEPIRTVNQEIPDLFNLGKMTSFQNFCKDVGRNLLRIDEIDSSGNTLIEGIEPRTNNKPVDVYFILHPLEEHLLEQLQNTSETIAIDATEANAPELSAIYRQATELGYLDEEINELIGTVQARGIVDRKDVAGTLYLYLVETFINFAEQKAKLEHLEQTIALAEANGFTFECENLSAAQTLAHTIGMENDEVQKDTLRQKLNSAETNLKNHCAEWVKTEHDNLERKVHQVGTLQREVPRVLEQTTRHPTTEFSTILFQRSVQPEVKSAYTMLSENIRKMQVEIRDICNREIGTYQADPTRQNAIETATRLKKVRARIDIDRAGLEQDGKNAEVLFRLFEQWRVLASKIEHDRQLMASNAEDTAVQNFIARLDDVQRLIRQRLADNRMDLKDVLSNHEHFKTQIDEIRKEFDAFIGEKETVFIADKAKIEGELAKVVDTPHIDVRWNPRHPEECHHDVRQKAVEKLKRDVIDTASNKVAHLKQDLLKPIEIYVVSDLLREKAVQLRGDMEQLADEFQGILRDLTSENVEAKLSEWVDELISIRKKGEAIFEKWAEIERQLIRPRTELTPNAQRLLDELTPQETNFTELVTRLLNDRSFTSTKDVLDCLEELYQGNWVNLTVRGR